MDFLPININIKGKHCLVVGGGNIALRKSKQLLTANAKLTIVSPKFHDDFITLKKSYDIVLVNDQYKKKYIKNKLLIIAATNNVDVNKQVFDDAEKSAILVNVVDQSDLCRFIMPSVVNRSPLTIAISSGGTAPVLARMLREKIEWMLPNNLGLFLLNIKKQRAFVAKKYSSQNERRNFWETFFERIFNWSVIDNIPSLSEAKLDEDEDEDVDFSLAEPLNEQSSLELIDIISFDINDLTIRSIKLLQKADEVHLTEKCHQLLKNIIRRDADLFLKTSEVINQDYIKNLIPHKTSSTKKIIVVQE